VVDGWRVEMEEQFDELEGRLAALESSTHQVPIKQPSNNHQATAGHWACARGCRLDAVFYDPDKNAYYHDTDTTDGRHYVGWVSDQPVEPIEPIEPITSDEKFRACPFCGRKGKYVYTQEGDHQVGCFQCNQFFMEDTKEKSIAAWNRRADDDEIDTLKETLRILRIEQGLLKESNSTYVREREDLRQDYLKASDRASKLEAANELLRDEVQDTLYCNENISKALEDSVADLTAARERIERLEQGIRDGLYHIRVGEKFSANAKLRAALKPAADLGRVDGEY
jgi:hypothetical protein